MADADLRDLERLAFQGDLEAAARLALHWLSLARGLAPVAAEPEPEKLATCVACGRLLDLCAACSTPDLIGVGVVSCRELVCSELVLRQTGDPIGSPPSNDAIRLTATPGDHYKKPGGIRVQTQAPAYSYEDVDHTVVTVPR